MAALSVINIQKFVHSIEQGGLAPKIRNTMFTVMIVALCVMYLFVKFKGFSTPTAMDQAQIARNVAAGQGLTTKFIRPLAIWQLEHAGKAVPADKFPDFVQSPLNPIINAIPLLVVKSHWKMEPTELVYAGERVIAAFSMLLFLLSLVVWYFVGARLFDGKLAIIGCAIVLVTDMMWQFTLSGLPQMLLLLLFAGASWLTLFAMGKKEQPVTMLAALFAAGLIFGLMILAHGLATWIFLGWLLFVGLSFPHRWLSLGVALAAALLLVLPWMVRNYSVCGNPFGLSIYSAVTPAGALEEDYMRSLDEPPHHQGFALLSKIRAGVLEQLGGIFGYLGMNVVAAAFFLSLLHPFRSPVAASFRWGLLAMWLASMAGMAAFGLNGEVSSNQLHVLFIPLFVFFGLAFFLILWKRCEIGEPIFRSLFLAGLIILAGLPMLSFLTANKKGAVQWPPYVPPFIAVLADWYKEQELLASDMPWAVAWYAQRKTVLLPETVPSFNEINDYRILGQPITGLYLTPITGNLRLFSDIYKGSYKDWALLITRPPRVEGFALPVFTALPIDGECIIFADRDRWNKAGR